MKLLFNLEVTEDSRIRARPSHYLNALEPQAQLAAVREFLAWAEREATDNSDPRARAEAGIGVATARRVSGTARAGTATDHHGARGSDRP